MASRIEILVLESAPDLNSSWQPADLARAGRRRERGGKSRRRTIQAVRETVRYRVTVVTTHEGDLIYGLTVSAFSTLSIDPLLVLVCIRTGNRLTEMITGSGRFAVNILREEQRSVSQFFATPGVSRWSGAWIPRYTDRRGSIGCAGYFRQSGVFRLSGAGAPLGWRPYDLHRNRRWCRVHGWRPARVFRRRLPWCPGLGAGGDVGLPDSPESHAEKMRVGHLTPSF